MPDDRVAPRSISRIWNVRFHPYYRIAKAQLDEALGGMPVEERFALDVKRAEKPELKPFSRSINLDMCDDFTHVIKSDSDRCQCGEKKRE